MLDVTAEMIADSLAGYREPATAAWILTSSDHDLTRVCVIASWLLHRSRELGNGRQMITARAVSLAAVFLHEGHPRGPARQQRRRLPTHQPTTDAPWNPGRRPLAPLAAVITAPPVSGSIHDAWASLLGPRQYRTHTLD